MDDLDIWRSAKALIDNYGEDATIHAALRADELLAQGNPDGAGTWRRIGPDSPYLRGHISPFLKNIEKLTTAPLSGAPSCRTYPGVGSPSQAGRFSARHPPGFGHPLG